jgi:hypothetical protein
VAFSPGTSVKENTTELRLKSFAFRVEPPVAAMKKSRSQERPRRKWCLENPVPSVATTGFKDFWKGGSEPMARSEKTSCSVGPKWMYAFDCRKAKKLIPVEAGFVWSPKQIFTPSLNQARRRGG